MSPIRLVNVVSRELHYMLWRVSG